MKTTLRLFLSKIRLFCSKWAIKDFLGHAPDQIISVFLILIKNSTSVLFTKTIPSTRASLRQKKWFFRFVLSKKAELELEISKTIYGSMKNLPESV